MTDTTTTPSPDANTDEGQAPLTERIPAIGWAWRNLFSTPLNTVLNGFLSVVDLGGRVQLH